MDNYQVERATLRDIARCAGVSIATVSHVINGSRPVGEQVKKRVLDAIEQLNYQRNSIARELRMGSSELVGVLIIDHNPFYTDILRGIEEEVETQGWKVIVVSTGESWKKQRELMNALASRRVEGLLMAPAAGITRADWEQFQVRAPKTVFFDRVVPDIAVPSATTANHEGSYLAVSHLVEHGYKQIGFVCSGDDISTMHQRHEGFIAACQDFGVEYRVAYGPATSAGGYEGMSRLIHELNRPHASLVANNQMMIGALLALSQNGISVPENMALIGFDHQPWMEVMNPSLTVIAQPADKLGKAAVQLLLQHKTLNKHDVQNVVLPLSLHLGKSCGCK